eukprot:1161034-Pelagomonas_calceolata.AAC.6
MPTIISKNTTLKKDEKQRTPAHSSGHRTPKRGPQLHPGAIFSSQIEHIHAAAKGVFLPDCYLSSSNGMQGTLKVPVVECVCKEHAKNRQFQRRLLYWGRELVSAQCTSMANWCGGLFTGIINT